MPETILLAPCCDRQILEDVVSNGGDVIGKQCRTCFQVFGPGRAKPCPSCASRQGRAHLVPCPVCIAKRGVPALKAQRICPSLAACRRCVAYNHSCAACGQTFERTGWEKGKETCSRACRRKFRKKNQDADRKVLEART